MLYAGVRQRFEDVPFTVDVVDSGDAVQRCNLHLRRDSQADAPPLPWWLGRTRDLLLELLLAPGLAVLRLVRAVRRLARAFRRWWRARYGVVLLVPGLWYEERPTLALISKRTLSYCPTRPHLNSTHNKWLTCIIPVR